MKVYFGADHAGFELKERLKKFVSSLGYEAIDCGNDHLDMDDNYPDYIIPTAQAVAKANSKDVVGIIIGGSGQGEAMAANRVPGIRATVFYGPHLATRAVDHTGRKSTDPYEIVNLSRSHNAANMLAIGVRFVSDEEAETAVKQWLESDPEVKERYMRRINQVEEMKF